MKPFAVLLMVSVAATGIITIGCSTAADTYGAPISKSESTDIKDILVRPQDYAGKTVTIEGTIVRECPTGCWFDLESGNAVLHVDINPAGFAIPQEVGSRALVEGEIQYLDNQVSMLGQGVKIQ